MLYDVLIIGAGPAGLTAAIYTARANLQTLVFEGWQPGGQLTTTTVIENFPGFRDGIPGPQLMSEMRAQAERFGTQYVSKDISRIDFTGKPFKVFVGAEEYTGKSVIIATGSKPRTLGLETEKRLWGKGVSSCATCDGFFFRGKTVAVLGGGDSAMEEANFLTRFASKAYLIHRRDAFSASQIMLDRAKANPKIEMLTCKIVEEILGTDRVTGLRLKDTAKETLSEIAIDGMFLAIGHTPVTELFKDQLETDPMGYLVCKQNTMTSIPGVFAAGDVADHRYRQAITSAGSGCMASIDVKKWLAENAL